MKSFPPFSAKQLLSERLDLVSSALVLNKSFRLHLALDSLDSAIAIALADSVDPVVCFDVLLLWQFGFLMLESSGLLDTDYYLVSIHPFGIQSCLYDDQASLLASFSDPIGFSLRVKTGREPPALPYSLPEVVDSIVGSKSVSRLLRLRSLPCVQDIVSPLLALDSSNCLSYLNKYAFRRSSDLTAASEKCFNDSVSLLPNHALKGVTNVSPTLRRGQPASLSTVQDLVRLVFRKVIRSVITVNPPVLTFTRSTPSPGGLATCEAFILHGVPGSTSSLLYYDSEHDSFVDCCIGSSPVLQNLAKHAHRESMLNYQSDEWAETVVIFASDLWALERKYGIGAFSLACLEVGVIAEAVHNQLAAFQLAGCLCGSMQVWPLLALAHPSRYLLPMMGYSLMQL